MTVDLSKARKGDKVKFRCGGEVVLDACGKPLDQRVTFQFGKYIWTYYLDGSADLNPSFELHVDSPFDIVAVNPAPFDWTRVRPGMAFRPVGRPPNFVWYIGPALNYEGFVVCAVQDHGPVYGIARVFEQDRLVRDDRHDIEITRTDAGRM